MEIRLIDKSGIYKITSPSGRVYIGRAVNIGNRWDEYRRLKYKYQPLLRKSVLKYGWINHLFEVVEFCDEDKLNQREIYWIAILETNANKHKDGNGLNLTDGGEGSSGYKHTKESRVKMSAFQSSYKRSPESNIKRSLKLKGRKASPNLILKLKGSKQSEEHKRKRALRFMKPVIDLSTGEKFPSAKEAAERFGLNQSTLKGWLNGNYNNNSTLIYAGN